MFKQYCIDTLRFLKANKDNYYKIEYVLVQIGIDTSLAGAIRQELDEQNLLTCHIDGCWINEKGIAYLAKIDLGDINKNEISSINNGIIINNSDVSQSSLNFDLSKKAHTLPEINPTPKHRQPYQYTGLRLASIMLWISDHIIHILIGVISTVLGGYILFKMGWIG